MFGLSAGFHTTDPSMLLQNCFFNYGDYIECNGLNDQERNENSVNSNTLLFSKNMFYELYSIVSTITLTGVF